jgi:hypothetical protein
MLLGVSLITKTCMLSYFIKNSNDLFSRIYMVKQYLLEEFGMKTNGSIIALYIYIYIYIYVCQFMNC